MVRLTTAMTRGTAARIGLVALLVLGGTLMLANFAGAAEPRAWQLGFQPSATPVHERINRFHNELLVIITLITIFVLGLLVYVMVRFHHTRNPVPTRTSHNTVIEIIWTVAPVIILVAIAIPSFKLMYFMDRVPNPDMTVKVTAHQWYWSYAYPDEKIAFDSNIVPDDQLKDPSKRLLEVDNPLVVPVDANIQVQVTGTDVIHSWFVPSFGVQEYAIIGRLNESWFRVEQPGSYYGECNQICGINHSRMPIKVVAMTKADYAKWLAEAKTKFAVADPSGEPAPSAAKTSDVKLAADKPKSGAPAGN